MRILAIDTALTACAAGVYDTRLGATLGHESVTMERGHAEALLPLVARVIDTSGVEFGALDRVAVTVGPGSFTGLRVGISAARGIGLAASKPVVGVSTLAALAAPSIAEDLADVVIAAIDARHGHVYAEVFGAGGRSLMAAGYFGVDEIVAAVDGEVHLVGPAAALLAEHWPATRARPLMLRPERTPDLFWAARLAASVDPALAPANPLYLRQPDAKPQDDLLPRAPS